MTTNCSHGKVAFDFKKKQGKGKQGKQGKEEIRSEGDNTKKAEYTRGYYLNYKR